MAYSINNKVYTDHSLMDEIVYNLKKIMSGIVLKNENTANENETEASLEESDWYISCKQDNVFFSSFPFSVEMLIDFGFTVQEARIYVDDRNLIDPSLRDKLLDFGKSYYIDHYVEQNNYYRELFGLPKYNTTEYDVYLDQSDKTIYDMLKKVQVELLDLTKPVHQFNTEQIYIIDSGGILDYLIDKYKEDFNYNYLSHLTNKKIDYYMARIAIDWDILYIPEVEPMVVSRFKELFSINRDIYHLKLYQDAYKFQSDYFDEVCMIMTITQTVADIISELPEWYIRRDIFDLRSCKYFLESNGIKFFKEIPLKYQIRLVKNINKLIRYKSTTQNIYDIIDIFDVPGTEIFKYFIFKNYNKEDKDYSLEMIRVPLDDTYDKYIENNMYREDYDAVTLLDKYWDGPNTHEAVKAEHLAKDFSIEGTKYMFTDYTVDQSEYQYQISYFTGLLFDKNINTDNLTVMIPDISETSSYSLRDLCMLVICLSEAFFDRSGKVIIPFSERTTPMPEFYLYKDYNGGDPDDGNEPLPPPGPTPGWEMDDVYDFGEQGIDIIKYDSATGLMLDFGRNYIPDPEGIYHYYDFNFTREENSTQQPDSDNNESDGELNGGHPWDIDINGNSNDNDIVMLYKYHDDFNGGEIPYSILDNESFRDWLKDHRELYVNTYGRILGFNLNADIEAVEQNINIRCSTFDFKEHEVTIAGETKTIFGFSLVDFGLQDPNTGEILFKTADSVDNIDDLVEIYRSNTECYRNFIDILENDVDNYDKSVFANYIFYSLFTTSFDKDFYRLDTGEIAKTYDQVLKKYNYSLYKFFLSVMEEKDTGTRKENIRYLINNIIETLESFVGQSDLTYIFSFTPVNSLEAIVNYIQLVIDFFKSWKVYFLDPVVTYILDEKTENKVYTGDRIASMKYSSYKKDNLSPRDALQIYASSTLIDRNASAIKEILDICAHYSYDPKYPGHYNGGEVITDDYDIDLEGGEVTADAVPYVTVNGGVTGARMNLDDMDGSTPMNVLHEVDSNGGDVDDYPSHNFVLDGGKPKYNYTKMVDTTIEVKNTVVSNVRLANFDSNGIEIYDDGLYIGSNNLTTNNDFNSLKNKFSNESMKISNSLKADYDKCVSINNGEYLDNIITNNLNNYLYALNYMNSDSYTKAKEDLKNNINDASKEIRTWFLDQEIFSWGSF